MHRGSMAQGPGASHGSNSNSDNGDDRKKAASSSAALQGATLAFASRTDQKQPRNNGSPGGTIPARQPEGRALNDGARKAAMIAEAAVNSRATASAGEDDDRSVSYGIGAVKDRIQLFSHPNDGGGSTAPATPAPQPAESSKTVASLRNDDLVTYRSTIADTTTITRPKIGPENNPQRIAARVAVDRSTAGPKAGSRSPSRAAFTTTISSRQTREYQELITHEPQRAFSSPTIREDDINIVTSSGRDGSYAPLNSEVTDAEEPFAARNMPAQQKYGVNTPPPPLPHRSMTTRNPSPREKMDSEPDQGSIPPPPPPRRNRAVSPPPALPPRPSAIAQGREKPPPPAPRQSTTSSSIVDRPLAPRGPLPPLPRSNPLPLPLPLPNARASPPQPQHSGVPESPLTDAIAASALASRRTPSPSKHDPPPLPPSRRSRSRSFLQVTHSGNRNDRHDRLGRRSGLSRTPSPNKTTAMKRTMRAPAQPEPDFAASGGPRSKEHSRRIIRTHPNKHREGDRKRWRDKVTVAERKRYEGVWAANKGLFIGVHEQVNIKDKSVVLEEAVSSIVVRDIWTRSRLPTQMLEQIWNIVSHHAYGLLSREEFVVGMWLIDQCLKGHKLPVKVSQSVWDSVRSVSADLTGH